MLTEESDTLLIKDDSAIIDFSDLALINTNTDASSSSFSNQSLPLISISSEETYREIIDRPLNFKNQSDEWFHGYMTRNEAEEKLRQVNIVGSFLIRESDSLPNTFALSFMKSPGEIVHFRITSVCGEYYADDKRFTSLIQLVQFYATQVEICAGRFLTNPVKPSSTAEISQRKVIALVSFRGMQDTDELSFFKSDIFTVIEKLDGKWLWVECDRTKERGMVYDGLVTDADSETLSAHDLPYFYDTISPQEASQRLEKAGKGSYLLKSSESCPTNLTLFLNTGRKIDRVSIRKTKNNRFEVGERSFKSVHSVIERYSKTEICDGILLQKPLYKFCELPDSNQALDSELYKNLRVERQTYKSGGSKAAKSGYLYSKSEDEKKWRHMYLVLKEVEGQLLIYGNEKQAKPKSVLDLCHCSYHDVHISLFDKPYCFQLVLNGFKGRVYFYFYADYEVDYQNWTLALKALCSGYRRRFSSPFSCFRRISEATEKKNVRRTYHLNVQIFEAKFDSSKSCGDAFGILSVNGAKVYKTATCHSIFASQTPQNHNFGQHTTDSFIFNEKISLENLNGEVTTVSIDFQSRSKRLQRHVELGTGTIDLASLKGDTNNNNGSSTKEKTPPATSESVFVLHEWIRLKIRDSDCGQCLIQLRYERLQIMPTEEYGSLFEILKLNDFDLCRLLAEVSCDDDKHHLSIVLLNIFHSDHLYIDLIVKELSREIDDCAESACLFRNTSFASILMFEFLHRDALQYVQTALEPVVRKIADCKVVLEIDSKKGCGGTNGITDHNMNETSSNATVLVEFSREVCRNLQENLSCLPKNVQYTLNRLKEKVSKKWTTNNQVKIQAVSSFLFLRLVFLAMLNPKKYGLVTTPLPECAQKNLRLVTRVVQKAACVREKRCCTSPDDYDYDLIESISNSFIDFKKEIVDYIEVASAPCNRPKTDLTEMTLQQKDIAPHFASILSLSNKHIDRLKTEPVQRVSAFLSVIEMLGNHMNQYLATR